MSTPVRTTRKSALLLATMALIVSLDNLGWGQVVQRTGMQVGPVSPSILIKCLRPRSSHHKAQVSQEDWEEVTASSILAYLDHCGFSTSHWEDRSSGFCRWQF